MSAFQDLEQKCVDLGLSAAGPKALISLLAERASWREDKLEEAYYKETNVTFKVGPSNFRTLILRLLEYGLAKEKKTEICRATGGVVFRYSGRYRPVQ